MQREDIEHLASLARIQLSEEEVQRLPEQLSSIVSYVSAVRDMTADAVAAEPQVGAVHNVFRKDVVTNEPEQYTEAMLEEMPNTEGRYLAVKKILTTDE
jgi:aspartyl-tRNA(Asn)/glutamyl-tRNA(Gln) amidotransferase subunit C